MPFGHHVFASYLLTIFVVCFVHSTCHIHSVCHLNGDIFTYRVTATHNKPIRSTFEHYKECPPWRQLYNFSVSSRGSHRESGQSSGLRDGMLVQQQLTVPRLHFTGGGLTSAAMVRRATRQSVVAPLALLPTHQQHRCLVHA